MTQLTKFSRKNIKISLVIFSFILLAVLVVLWIAASTSLVETSAEEQKYKVVFKNKDGAVYSENYYLYGDAIKEPTILRTITVSDTLYYLNGWLTYDEGTMEYTPCDVDNACTGDRTYYADFGEIAKEYIVKIKDNNDQVISEKTYHYGDPVEVPSATDLALPDDLYYHYTFARLECVEGKGSFTCQGNAVWKPVYNKTEISHWVAFRDYNGKVLKSRAAYHYGETLVVPETPVRAKDDYNTYVFAGWGEDFDGTCKGSVLYIATYTATPITYKVTFADSEGNVLKTIDCGYGEELTPPEIPEKEGDLFTAYDFVGWGKTYDGTCRGEITYTAQYEEIDPDNIFKVTEEQKMTLIILLAVNTVLLIVAISILGVLISKKKQGKE